MNWSNMNFPPYSIIIWYIVIILHLILLCPGKISNMALILILLPVIFCNLIGNVNTGFLKEIITKIIIINNNNSIKKNV